MLRTVPSRKCRTVTCAATRRTARTTLLVVVLLMLAQARAQPTHPPAATVSSTAGLGAATPGVTYPAAWVRVPLPSGWTATPQAQRRGSAIEPGYWLSPRGPSKPAPNSLHASLERLPDPAPSLPLTDLSAAVAAESAVIAAASATVTRRRTDLRLGSRRAAELEVRQSDGAIAYHLLVRQPAPAGLVRLLLVVPRASLARANALRRTFQDGMRVFAPRPGLAGIWPFGGGLGHVPVPEGFVARLEGTRFVATRGMQARGRAFVLATVLPTAATALGAAFGPIEDGLTARLGFVRRRGSRADRAGYLGFAARGQLHPERRARRYAKKSAKEARARAWFGFNAGRLAVVYAQWPSSTPEVGREFDSVFAGLTMEPVESTVEQPTDRVQLAGEWLDTDGDGRGDVGLLGVVFRDQAGTVQRLTDREFGVSLSVVSGGKRLMDFTPTPLRTRRSRVVALGVPQPAFVLPRSVAEWLSRDPAPVVNLRVRFGTRVLKDTAPLAALLGPRTNPQPAAPP